MVADLELRLANRFLDEGAIVHSKGPDFGGAEPVSVRDFLVQLRADLGVLLSEEIRAELDGAVRQKSGDGLQDHTGMPVACVFAELAEKEHQLVRQAKNARIKAHREATLRQLTYYERHSKPSPEPVAGLPSRWYNRVLSVCSTTRADDEDEDDEPTSPGEGPDQPLLWMIFGLRRANLPTSPAPLPSPLPLDPLELQGECLPAPNRAERTQSGESLVFLPNTTYQPRPASPTRTSSARSSPVLLPSTVYQPPLNRAQDTGSQESLVLLPSTVYQPPTLKKVQVTGSRESLVLLPSTVYRPPKPPTT